MSSKKTGKYYNRTNLGKNHSENYDPGSSGNLPVASISHDSVTYALDFAPEKRRKESLLSIVSNQSKLRRRQSQESALNIVLSKLQQKWKKKPVVKDDFTTEMYLVQYCEIEESKERVRRAMSRASRTLCWLAFIAMILTILDIELCTLLFGKKGLDFSSDFTDLSTRFDVWLKSNQNNSFVKKYTIGVLCVESLLSLVTIVTQVFVYRVYDLSCQVMKIQSYLPQNVGIMSSPLKKKFIGEMLACSFHLPPILNLFVPYQLQLLVLSRCYLVARHFRDHNQVVSQGKNSKNSRFLASIMHYRIVNSSFVIKSFIQSHPLLVTLLVCFVVICGVGYTTFVVERTAFASNHNSLMDTLWMQVVTMTSLGYGDVVPKSVLGRAITGITSFFGMFITAFLISTVDGILSLKNQEKRIIAYIGRQEREKTKREAAATFIQLTWLLHRVEADNSSYITNLKNKFYAAAMTWRKIAKNKAAEDPRASWFVAEDTLIKVTNLERNFERMEENINRIVNILPLITTNVQQASQTCSLFKGISKQAGEVQETSQKDEKTRSESLPDRFYHTGKPSSIKDKKSFYDKPQNEMNFSNIDQISVQISKLAQIIEESGKQTILAMANQESAMQELKNIQSNISQTKKTTDSLDEIVEKPSHANDLKGSKENFFK